jgi:hypothetical protein
MFNISVEKLDGCSFEINPMSIKRDWMDATPDRHAYRCFPVTQANVIGWNLTCKDDIEFEWDGITDHTDQHVKIFSPKNAYAGRGQSSLSLRPQLIFRTDANVSMWIVNPVNYFNDDFETMSALVSTSFYNNPLPLAIRAKTANKRVLIKAGTPIATLIPISLSNLNGTDIEIVEYPDDDKKRLLANMSYGAASQKVNSTGEWTDWYRDAVNEKGETLGAHEVKTLKLGVIDKTKSDIV